MSKSLSLKIALIGAGRLGTQMALALEKAGHRVAEIYNPTPEPAGKLASLLYSSRPVASLNFSQSSSTLFVLAVPDDAIDKVAAEIVLPDDAIVVHTSGASSLEILEITAAENFGVFWPIQSFSHGAKMSFTGLPIAVEGSNALTENILHDLAATIGAEAVVLDETERKNLHLAAVFAGNFTNHMLTAAEAILDRNSISVQILRPLVEETIRKAFELGPRQAQTGPAARGDDSTLCDQEEMLNDDEPLLQLYRLISEDIAYRKEE